MRILVLDLDGRHGDGLCTLLDGAGHDTVVVRDLPPAIDRDADVVLVAGGGDAAIDACRRIRAGDQVLPIMLLTAEGIVEDRVAGLRAGADDALAAPYAPSQMMARVDALGRRARLLPRLPEIVEADGCLFDLSRQIAVRESRQVGLTRREADLIRWLHRHRDRAASRAEILEHVFGVSPNVETRSVDMAIATLRRKIERRPDEPAIIVSVKGVGYAWGPAALAC
jgi:DNA-binding response OmpR family regulator